MRAPIVFALSLIVAATGGCRPQAVAPAPSAVLLYTGTGTSSGDVAAMQALLDANGVAYATATTAQVNAMAAVDWQRHRLLIVPGGNFIDIGDALTPAAARQIHDAVHDGVNYLGICAGGFLAGRITGHNSFDLTSGIRFGFYTIADEGIRKAAVRIATPGGPTLEQYWEDGPQFTGWGTPVATYPDGTPAIVEGAFGRGWVLLSGVHPEAPASWRRGLTFATPVHADNTYAATLVRAALTGRPLARQ